MKPKTIAFYLPQFHRVPENDEWWGEGFTEWTAVRGAKPLFEGHNQPRVPLNKNYYNLLEYETMAWQADLMKEYLIDGMCIYHYWFENGRRILEKPAENLLKWKDIQMPFCFDWANVSWIKTWKKFKADSLVWSSVYEQKNGLSKDGVLMQQCYGREKEWEEHFQYLLCFFNDERYIKLNGKPVFVIDTPKEICCLGEMANYFNIRAKENGFQGVYFIGARDCEYGGLDAIFTIQPTQRTDSYDQMWEETLNRNIPQNKKMYFCGGVDFDNSPRMGKDAFIMKGASPQKFYRYFKKLYRKSLLLNNEFVFINAWNEWGEGMYLEPDEKNGYGYLKAVSTVVAECGEESLIRKKATVKKFYETKLEKTLRKTRETVQIFRKNDKLLDDWTYLKNHKINISHFFRKYGYKDVAIYGMGKLGRQLLYELNKGGIKVSFGIDRNSKLYRADIGIKIYSPRQKMPKTDAVVITNVDQYGKISKMLSGNMNCSMITIEEIIQELMPER